MEKDHFNTGRFNEALDAGKILINTRAHKRLHLCSHQIQIYSDWYIYKIETIYKYWFISKLIEE